MNMHVIVSVPTLRPLIEECKEDMEEEEEAAVSNSDEDEQDFLICNT